MQKIRTIELEGKTIKLQIVSCLSCLPLQSDARVQTPSRDTHTVVSATVCTCLGGCKMLSMLHSMLHLCSGTQLGRRGLGPSRQVTTEEHMASSSLMTSLSSYVCHSLYLLSHGVCTVCPCLQCTVVFPPFLFLHRRPFRM